LVTTAVTTVTKEIADLKKELATEKLEAEKTRNLLALTQRVDSGLASLKSAGWMDEGIERAMARFNRKTKPDEA